MLKGYFDNDELEYGLYKKKAKRIVAVEAALEIIKASAGSGTGATSGSMAEDLTGAAELISKLADAIQAALDE